MGKRVLVIAAHPDDELLGCGGTLALHARSGDEVHSLILCEGESMRHQETSSKKVAISESAKILGIRRSDCVGLPDQHLDTLPIVDVVKHIESKVNDFKPNIIYCHSNYDLNKDHQIAFQAALVALRPKNDYIEDVFSFYIVGSTELGYPRAFNPDIWIGFDEEIMNIKLKAFSCYKTEICNYPNPRSLKALRNLSMMYGNQCCMEYAEVFEVVRSIRRYY